MPHYCEIHVLQYNFVEALPKWAETKLGDRSDGAFGTMNSGRQGGFHRKHGTNIRLSEENTIAHRTDSYNNSVVFTEQPIAVGNTFLVELLDKGGGWAGSIVSWGHTNTS